MTRKEIYEIFGRAVARNLTFSSKFAKDNLNVCNLQTESVESLAYMYDNATKRLAAASSNPYRKQKRTTSQSQNELRIEVLDALFVLNEIRAKEAEARKASKQEAEFELQILMEADRSAKIEELKALSDEERKKRIAELNGG